MVVDLLFFENLNLFIREKNETHKKRFFENLYAYKKIRSLSKTPKRLVLLNKI